MSRYFKISLQWPVRGHIHKVSVQMWGHKGKGRLKPKKKSVVNKNGVRPFIVSGINLMVSKPVGNKILNKPKSVISISVINGWI